jgi:predicted lactoylglutathione lyase
MITLGVRDLQHSIAFYEKLGFHRQNNDEGVAFFDLNGSWLGLYGYEALAEDAHVEASGGTYGGFSLAHNVESEHEVDLIFQHAIEVGAIVTKQPQKVFWGGYSGYFKDLDGHLWEIAYNPFLWIGPKDADKRE